MQGVDKSRLRDCRSQVHTDSLTVALDLSLTSPIAASAFRNALFIPKAPQGLILQSQNLDIFQHNVRAVFAELSAQDPQSAFEFVTLLSTLFHECRHVHDMRCTRTGAELLLADLRVYSGIGKSLDRLLQWSRASNDEPIPLPVVARLGRFDGNFKDVADFLGAAKNKRDRINNIWQSRSKGPCIPGHSIHSLYEALGFSVQIEWLAATFGREVADFFLEATIGPKSFDSEYLRPLWILARRSAAGNVQFDPEPDDLSCLIVNALNVSGLEEAYSDSGVTENHPGTWFDRFCERYISLGRVAGPVVDKPLRSVVMTMQKYSRELGQVINAGTQKIRSLQDEALKDLVLPSFDRMHISEPILLATEVAVDYVEMQQLIYKKRREYHAPMGYVELLLSGDLTPVFVRMKNEDGDLTDFRMPSYVPTQVGGSRIASEASQQMRVLLNGRSRGGGDFFEEVVFNDLRGKGLHFKIVAG